MKLTYEEKKSFLEELKNRMLKIEGVVGDIKFYDKISSEKNKIDSRDKPFEHSDNEPNTDHRDHLDISIPTNEIKNEEIGEREENQKQLDEIKACLEHVPADLIRTNKEEIVEMVKKHRHKNSISVHICTIKLILQQISKEFLHDVYSQYKDFYIYIHSNSILDVYSTFEYKRNILLSHLDFMKSYSSQIKKIMELKEYINSYKISETDILLDRLNKIERKNETLFSKIASVNSSLEDAAYKYALMVQVMSKIISKHAPSVS
ncbi:conserved Plasmodium protein, unknown function [Plasmodium ovale]|uniref:Uncharacterized protein n=2 Tax=Plasmodium ovale TaxID=36330 RepID=A0A1A8WA15_PLAOA|nr:conserved Plasmodium protein, unknown function [Plasmodium ovale curtisi]SBS98551.1 conserved Plasmodium protein, unknown function [Plasmodium ovale curtisi]SCQ17195.1 conserved Plasmodium protein, unknown function [Plasmodium ovale]